MKPSLRPHCRHLTPNRRRRLIRSPESRRWASPAHRVRPPNRRARLRRGRARRQSAQTQWKAAQLKLNDLLGASRINELHALIDYGLAKLNDTPASLAEND
jgi:hypothetical protein